MSDTSSANDSRLLALTAKIVAAHAANNTTEPAELPALIQSVHAALVGVETTSAPSEERKQPVVPIKRSVFPDYLICLEDRQKVKMLKRYISVRFGLTPEAYRTKWGLPESYPMVAPNYSKRRSGLAKEHGLGRTKWRDTAAAVEAEPEVEVQQVPEGASGVRKTRKSRNKAAAE